MKITTQLAERVETIFNGDPSTWPEGVYQSQRKATTFVFVTKFWGAQMLTVDGPIGKASAPLTDGYKQLPAGTTITIGID